jgi:hypothetical protein
MKCSSTSSTSSAWVFPAQVHSCTRANLIPGTSLTLADYSLLRDHPSDARKAIALFPKRDDVDKLNTEMTDKLRSCKHIYKYVDHFKWNLNHIELSEMQKLASDGSLAHLYVSLLAHRLTFANMAY